MKARQLYSRVSVEADIDSLEDSRAATAAVPGAHGSVESRR